MFKKKIIAKYWIIILTLINKISKLNNNKKLKIRDFYIYNSLFFITNWK